MSSDTGISLYGKYRFFVTDNGNLVAERYGEPWREFVGDKAVHALFDYAQETKRALTTKTAELEACRVELEACKRDAKKLAKWISHNHKNALPDHACAECVPHSDILIAGFQCGLHRAIAIDAAIKGGEPG